MIVITCEHMWLRSRLGIAALTVLVLLSGVSVPVCADAVEGLPKPKGKVILTISGKIGKKNRGATAVFDRDMLEGLGIHTIKTSTPWLDGVSSFEGILMRDLLNTVDASGGQIRVIALNDYDVHIPVSDFKEYPVLLALKRNGKYMSVREKGPLWAVYPWDDNEELRVEKIYERSVWQIKSIIVQ